MSSKSYTFTVKNIYAAIIVLVLLLSFFHIQSYANMVDSGSSAKNEQPTDINSHDNIYKRGTPRSSFEGFITALKSNNYRLASKYLDLRNPKFETSSSAKTARDIKELLDKYGELYQVGVISNNPAGNIDEKHDVKYEQIGIIKVNEKEYEILLENINNSNQNPIWLLSDKSIGFLLELSNKNIVTNNLISLPSFSNDLKINGVSIEQWIFLLITLISSIIISYIIIQYVKKTIFYLFKSKLSPKRRKISNLLFNPALFLLSVLVFTLITNNFLLSVIARQYIGYIVLVSYVVSLFVFLWEFLNIASIIIKLNSIENKNYAALSGVEFFKKLLKFLLIAITTITILSLNGYDITTWLTAIGIGGLAIALGAQKTIENIVGSLSIIVDQPVRIGDFCQIGEIRGTVEQIGIRSTRIRTLDFKLITIPNAEFSSQKIENFTQRTKFLYAEEIGVRYETTTEQITYILINFRELLYAHKKVESNKSRVRFVKFASSSLTIEIFAPIINVDEYTDYLKVVEDLNLRIMKIVKDSGSGFAFPSTTVYITKEPGLAKDRQDTIKETIDNWQRDKKLYMPDHSYDRIKQIEDTIDI